MCHALVVSLNFWLVVCLFFFHNAKEFLLIYSEQLKTVISVYKSIQILFLTHKSPGTRRESEFT